MGRKNSLKIELGPVAKDLLAGTIGGMAGIVAGQPLDTIKVRHCFGCGTNVCS